MHLRLLFVGLLLPCLSSCSSDDKKKSDTPASSSTTVTFADVAPIIKTNCSASGCHGTAGASSVIYEANEANASKDKAKIKARINLAATDSLLMPPKDKPQLSAADKEKLNNYVK